MSKTSKYLLMIGIYLFLSLLFLIGIECGLRAFGYGVDLDHLFLQTANGKYLYLNKNISRRYFTQSQATEFLFWANQQQWDFPIPIIFRSNEC